uniref:TPR_REGION domain-containing protein n=1 Tax=Anisakis simplex TaxID=6269 RepID=A0A0M3IYM2_ANISI
LEYFEKAHEATDNKDLKSQCEYAICCCHFYMKNPAKSLEHLHKSLQLKISFIDNEDEGNEQLTRNDRLDKALLEWFCGESIDSLETMQVIADECCDERVAMALDETCLYEVLECGKFVGVPLLHAKMMHGDFDRAKNIIDEMYKNRSDRNIASIIDEAIVLWNRNEIQECVTLLDEYLRRFQYIDDSEQQQIDTSYNGATNGPNIDNEANIDTNEISILAMHNNANELLKLVNLILIVCIINPNNEDSVVEALAIAERFVCDQLKRSNPLMGTQTNVSAESTRQCLRRIQQTSLYCFRVERFVLCWYKQQGDQLRVFFITEANPTNHLSKFYAHFLEQFLLSSKLKCYELSEFEKLKSEANVLINVDSFGGVQYENRIALHSVAKCSTTRTDRKICLLIATDDRNSLQIDHVHCLNEDDLIWKLQVCSLALLDCSRLKMDSFSILQYQLSINIAIVLNDPCEKVTKALLIAGAECVVNINSEFNEHLKIVLQKLINGDSLENCLGNLRGSPLRLYGNRNAICHSNALQSWRKAVISTENLDGNDLINVEYPQYVELVEELKRLPPQRYSRIIDLMQSNNTQQIYAFMNELENELEQLTSIEGSTSCFLTTVQSNDRASDCNGEIKGLIALCKRVFDDHLYGLDDTDSMHFEDAHLNELMKSFALKEREVKRRRRRRKCSVARKCWSEGEGSARCSLSESNTDTEAVIIDIEVEKYV